MKIKVWITGSVLWLCAIEALQAAPPPPLDRPTPPPCCADGLCYPNPVTWGHYATRWRRWPTDYLEPLPPEAQPPAPLPSDIRPFETPPPEEEDRRAPPPTEPRGEPESQDQAPAPPAGGAASGAPTAPPTAPLRPSRPSTTLPLNESDEMPTESAEPYDTSPPPTTLPFGGEPPTPLPFGEPMGDADPPPALPFASGSQGRGQTGRAATTPQGQPLRRPAARTQPNDPPPAMPIAMASWN